MIGNGTGVIAGIAKLNAPGANENQGVSEGNPETLPH
jgi:hypothetical protein